MLHKNRDDLHYIFNKIIATLSERTDELMAIRILHSDPTLPVNNSGDDNSQENKLKNNGLLLKFINFTQPGQRVATILKQYHNKILQNKSNILYNSKTLLTAKIPGVENDEDVTRIDLKMLYVTMLRIAQISAGMYTYIYIYPIPSSPSPPPL